MSERRIGWGALLLVFALAFGLRSLAVVQHEARHPLAQRPAIDEASYDSWAREIAGGELVGREIFFQEPLYPYVLGGVYALAGDEPASQRRAARWLQAGWGALAAGVAAALSARLFGERAGWVAGALVALHRPSIWFPALLLKENLFVLALVALALGIVATRARETAPWRWLGLGALAAAGALLRGNLLVMLPVLAAWPVVRALLERRWRWRVLADSLAFALGATLVLAPVALRNQHVGGRLVLSTSGAGTNFYGGNNLDNPFGLAKEFDWVRGIPEHEAGDWRREASRRAGRELDATEASAFWMRAALESMESQPLAHVRILWNKLRLTLGSYEVPDNHFLEWDARYLPVLGWPLPGFALVGALGLAGVFSLLLLRKRAGAGVDFGAAIEVAALLVLYVGTVVLTVTSERIRLPIVPLLAPFAAFFVLPWPGTDTPWFTRFAKLGVLGLAAGLVVTPVIPATERSEDLDERDHNLAVALVEAGELDEAAGVVDGLFERRADSPRVKLLAADFSYRLARRTLDSLPQQARVPAEAGERIERSLRLLEGVVRQGNAQERYRAHLLAGAIRQYLGHWSLAEAEYRAARAFDDEDRDLRRRLAVVVAEVAMKSTAREERTRRLDEALALLDALLAEQEDRELRDLRTRFDAARAAK